MREAGRGVTAEDFKDRRRAARADTNKGCQSLFENLDGVLQACAAADQYGTRFARLPVCGSRHAKDTGPVDCAPCIQPQTVFVGSRDQCVGQWLPALRLDWL